MVITSDEPRVYVGTYAKYNNGSLTGKWLTLLDYVDKDDFITACLELHKDESDPELMFQDMEGIPKGLGSESSIDEYLWEFMELDEDDRTIASLWADYQGTDLDASTVESAKDAYTGAYRDETDWAENYLEDTGMLQEIPEHLRYYFDYKKYARDAFMGDMLGIEHECYLYVFYNH